MQKVPCEIYDRCVGYFRPTEQMNKGKQEEQSMRKRFDANAYCKGEFKKEEVTA